MARRQRLAAQAARASLQTPIPRLSDNEDDEMNDIPTTDAPTPQDEDEDNEDADEEEEEEDQIEENDELEEATPSRSERLSRSATPRRRGRPSRGALRRRGRPSRVESLKNDVSEDEKDVASDVPTPKRRGGFRGHRGGRWGKLKAGTARTAQVPVDDEGNALSILNDEVELPDDPEGERKIDKSGRLLGGREYRVRTFTLLGRENRLYMLSTEPARCIGFRDSYLFFQKHKHLYKIIIDDDEKRDLIDRDLIPHSYKGRAIGVVTARSVFREFGAKIVIGGKKVTDDYNANGARERGDIEGELAVPEDRLPGPGEPYNRNQYVAWHGASAVYHTNLPSVPLQHGKPIEAKRKRIAVTGENWMLEHARDSSRFNNLLTQARRENDHGIYDIHTNIMQWPNNLQPTHARWENVAQVSEVNTDDKTHKFEQLADIYTRNFRIHDLHLETAPDSSLPRPGFGCGGSTLPHITADTWDELPTECRIALEQAAGRENSWRSKWLNEKIDGHRSQFLPSVEWYPK